MSILSRHRQGKEKAMKDYSNSEMEKVIDEYIHNQRNRAIMKRRLIDGICIEPLAEEFDLSPRQISNIILSSEDILFRHL